MLNNADTNKITRKKNFQIIENFNETIKGEQQKGNEEFLICCDTRLNKG